MLLKFWKEEILFGAYHCFFYTTERRVELPIDERENEIGDSGRVARLIILWLLHPFFCFKFETSYYFGFYYDCFLINRASEGLEKSKFFWFVSALVEVGFGQDTGRYIH